MISDYIDHLLAKEEYSFSIEELLAYSSKDVTSIRSELARLIQKKRIVNLRKGFYLIIPPRYSASGKLPLTLYVTKLFKYLNRSYYIGLYSAAKTYGASHQQVHREYILIEKPMMNAIAKQNIDINFYTATHWPRENISQMRADAGNYLISSPALTFMDLINYHSKIGGLSRMLASLEELAEEINAKDIQSLLMWYDNRSVLQRAGFLFEELSGQGTLSSIVYSKLQEKPYYPVLLSPAPNLKPGSANNRWRVDINVKLENDL